MRYVHARQGYGLLLVFTLLTLFCLAGLMSQTNSLVSVLREQRLLWTRLHQQDRAGLAEVFEIPAGMEIAPNPEGSPGQPAEAQEAPLGEGH